MLESYSRLKWVERRVTHNIGLKNIYQLILCFLEYQYFVNSRRQHQKDLMMIAGIPTMNRPGLSCAASPNLGQIYQDKLSAEI